MEHPSLETMASLLAGDLSHEVVITQVVPHLVEQCSRCREHYEKILRLQKEVGHWDERVVVVEGLQAPELLARLKDLPFDEQLGLVMDDETFQTWGLCQLLLKESLDAAFDDAGKSINCAELAVRVSHHLGTAYDPNWVLDLRSRAYAYLGNAQRVLGELRSAETAFRDAERFLARSTTGNPLIQAEVLHLKASLRRAQRRLAEAMELVDQALEIYRNAGDSQTGAAVLMKAKILEESGDLEGAIALLRQAVEEIDSQEQQRLSLFARYNLVLCLAAAGRYEEADKLLLEVRESFAQEGRPLDLIRLRWTEGKIALGMDELRGAEEAFQQVREDFLSRGMGYDAALVSLDLSIIYIRERRTEDLKRLAIEILRVFESRDVHREAVAALILFQKACEEERLSVELASQIAALLQRERRISQ